MAEQEDDDLFYKIEKRVYKKPERGAFVPWNNKASKEMTRNSYLGKSGVYLREVIIPYKNRAIRDLKYQLKKTKRELATKGREERKKGTVRKNVAVKSAVRIAVKEAIDRRRQLKSRRRNLKNKITLRDIRNKAKQVTYARIKINRIQNSPLIDGISNFPLILDWCEKNKFDYKIFSIFVLMNHYRWFNKHDAFYYGYTDSMTKKLITKLRRAELVDRTELAKDSFVVTVKGKELFNKMRIEIYEKTKELFRNWDNNFPRRELTGLKFEKGEFAGKWEGQE